MTSPPVFSADVATPIRDSQFYLQCLINIVTQGKTIAPICNDVLWGELTNAFEALVAHLRQGNLPPVATGPIFGNGLVAIGYPGQIVGNPDRYDERPIRHVQSSRGSYAYAIMVANHLDHKCCQWVLRGYDHNGYTVAEWLFPSAQ